MLRTTGLLATILLGAALIASCAQREPRFGETTVRADDTTRVAVKKDVPYVPTHEKVVDKMLEMGKVGKDDVLYDLGCGDGRIVVTAAKRFGTRGLGVDIDPKRIRESNENAKTAGVTDLVQFQKKDLFTMDVSDASVVTLYLLPSVNMRLRPRLLEQLRPGSRVVSHDFHMEDWNADQTAEVKSDVRTHRVYMWVIPAKAEGAWRAGEADTLQLQQKFQNVTGTTRLNGAEAPIREGKLEGDRIRFTVDGANGGQPSTFEGRVNGNTITGTMKTAGAEQGREMTFRRG